MIIPFYSDIDHLKFTFTSGVLLGPGSIVVDCDVCWAKHLSWELGIQTYTSIALYILKCQLPVSGLYHSMTRIVAQVWRP